MLEFIYISLFYGILSEVHCLKLQILLGAVAYAFKTSAWGKKQVVFVSLRPAKATQKDLVSKQITHFQNFR